MQKLIYLNKISNSYIFTYSLFGLKVDWVILGNKNNILFILLKNILNVQTRRVQWNESTQRGAFQRGYILQELLSANIRGFVDDEEEGEAQEKQKREQSAGDGAEYNQQFGKIDGSQVRRLG